MAQNSQKYLFKALIILKTQSHLLLIPSLFLLLGYLPAFTFESGQNNEIFYLLTTLSQLGLMLSFPILFGKFIDFISNESKRPVIDIIKQNFWDYFVISIILNLPGALLTIFKEVVNSYYFFYANMVLDAGIDIFSLYIIPLVFYKTGKIPSMVLGGKCLVGNYLFSLPIILIVLFNYSIMTLFVCLQNSTTLLLGRDTLKLLLGGGVGIVSIVFNIWVFVSAALVLKDTFFTATTNLYNNTLEKDAP